ncbi:hypothetical protein P872_09645 [Rhodonellum psychrophilum GCM71 = DSM 17998]|uniref:Uncharacterized protein n=1 Tax=Rhodonellum psychrophilum GCM71 = DSM 17998 TaxID=1123057 RepID=U5BV18_9BACT|nr:hypothetical protein P872_09645 [Rhodonellum psychrophilum GCM71 = DSM 17998]
MPGNFHDGFSRNAFFQGQCGKSFSSCMGTDDFVLGIYIGVFYRSFVPDYFNRLVDFRSFAQLL